MGIGGKPSRHGGAGGGDIPLVGSSHKRLVTKAELGLAARFSVSFCDGPSYLPCCFQQMPDQRDYPNLGLEPLKL